MRQYLIAIAAHLPAAYGQDYRQALKGHGKPTMFICDVPWRQIDGNFMHEIAGYALSMLFQQLLDGEDYKPDFNKCAAFSISTFLVPSSIVGHYHPSPVRDPFR